MIWPPLLPVAQYSHTPWFQVRSRSHLVSRGVYPFVLALHLAQKEYWDTTRSHANAQNQGVGVRGCIGIGPTPCTQVLCYSTPCTVSPVWERETGNYREIQEVDTMFVSVQTEQS